MTAKEKLFALANAVREKSGEAGPLTLDRMTEIVGTLGGYPKGFEIGEFYGSDEADTGELTVSHSLGCIPNNIFIWYVGNDAAEGQWQVINKVNRNIEYDEFDQCFVPAFTFIRGMYSTKTGITHVTCSCNGYDTEELFHVPYNITKFYSKNGKYIWLATCDNKE